MVDSKNRGKLKDLRIIKRELVYIIGLSQELANEQKLKELNLLGQYGSIKKIIVNKDKPFNKHNYNGPSFSAYITFGTEEEASVAILAIDGFEYDRRTIKASYGMTKYCSFFVKNLTCPNDDCLYLHKYANNYDCFNKDEGNPARHALKISQDDIIYHIINNNKEFWGIRRDGQNERGSGGFGFPSVNSAWRKIKAYCKEHGIAYQIKVEKVKQSNPSIKKEKKVGSHLITTSKWESEDELPIFPPKNEFDNGYDLSTPVALEKSTSVKQDYELRTKIDKSISKSNIDFVKKDKEDFVYCNNKTSGRQPYTPKHSEQSKADKNHFKSPKSARNKTSIDTTQKTTEKNKRKDSDYLGLVNTETQDTGNNFNSNTEDEPAVKSEIEQILDGKPEEYSNLDKQIMLRLNSSYVKLKKKESVDPDPDQTDTVTYKIQTRTKCTDIKKIIDDFLKPDEELLSLKSRSLAKSEEDNHFRLFGQAYRIHIPRQRD